MIVHRLSTIGSSYGHGKVSPDMVQSLPYHAFVHEDQETFDEAAVLYE